MEMKFKVGDKVRVIPNASWHKDYIDKKFIVMEKDEHITFPHVFRLKSPMGVCTVLVQEKDLDDLVLEDEIINRHLRYPHIFNAMDIPEDKIYL